MAVRKIEFTVSSDGITPSVKQFAGVQGDHKATEVVFNIAPELYRSLTAQATNGARLIYRFDGYDGEGGFKSSDTAELTESQLSYELEEWLTRFGGIIKVVLVISLLKDDLTQMELFNFPALLQLKNSPEGVETDGINRESMSTLAQVAKDSANTAVESAEVAVEAQEKTEFARAAIENGTVWVFDGGDADGNVDLDGDGVPDTNTADIKFVIDGEMSDSSENAVMNKITKAYADKLFQAAKLEAHPIGSYYWSSANTNPSELFGGDWQQVKDRFVLAAGDTYNVGETGGAATHTLKESEMPSHNHYMFLTDSQALDILGDISASRRSIDLSYWGTVNTTYWQSANISDTGGNQPHNNMPPYEVAYCWKRIA